jgi:hypothetical protein
MFLAASIEQAERALTNPVRKLVELRKDRQ